MSKNRIFWIVLISVVVVAALAVGGYALYRWGYARGLAADARAIIRGDLPEELGELERFELGEPIIPWGRRMVFMPHSVRLGYTPFFWGAGLVGLILGGGVLALAVYGVISLVRRGRATGEELEAKAKK